MIHVCMYSWELPPQDNNPMGNPVYTYRIVQPTNPISAVLTHILTNE